MNVARYQKRQQRLQASALMAKWQEAQSTVKLDAKAIAALRARYGRGGFSAGYRDGECRPAWPESSRGGGVA
jgi:hypothetical protein